MGFPTTAHHLLAFALLFTVAFASDQCFTHDHFDETIKEMDETAQKMHLYRGVAHCFEERIRNLPPRRKYWNNTDDNGQGDEDDQVKCYARETLDAVLERCAKESGDYDKGEIDDSSRFYRNTAPQPQPQAVSPELPIRKGTRESTRLDTIVVRETRCTEAHFCCLWPNTESIQRDHCLERSGCENPKICQQRR